MSCLFSQVKTLPEEVCKLRNLEHLDAHNNEITEIPMMIDLLHHLNYLDLSQNAISVFPSTLTKVQRTQEILPGILEDQFPYPDSNDFKNRFTFNMP